MDFKDELVVSAKTAADALDCYKRLIGFTLYELPNEPEKISSITIGVISAYIMGGPESNRREYVLSQIEEVYGLLPGEATEILENLGLDFD